MKKQNCLYLSDEEKEKFRKAGEKIGLSLSAFLRFSASEKVNQMEESLN